MASFCRSAITATSRSLASRSKTVTQKTLNAKSMSSPFTSTPTRTILASSRFVSVLGSVESLMPLHNAIANARLKSSIAVDSSCWSWLSRVFFSTVSFQPFILR
ncbi:protein NONRESPONDING TO OXYLIPINS 2, mitochondrial-like isoform X1 [Populus nigra]|uniref:protein NONRESPONDING TO OXYLIPINS 2, mitochondrial-like isoform X1 n=1 Tax=Populus nigra TaxID=3691 RepID=UPI002B273732|nr:protein NONRESPONDING TO OXYLIPINS 2, mitochondrial-like isoform X1 [Populus nigra]